MGSTVEFLPRMQSEAQGFSLFSDLRWRSWCGFVADVWDVECVADAGGHYYSPDPRLFVVLELTPDGALELTDLDSGATVSHAKPLSMSYIPAGVRISSKANCVSRLRHLDIHLPEAALHRRFGRNLSLDTLNTTRLHIDDSRLGTLASLIAEECENDRPFDDAYGEGLMMALVCSLFDLHRFERKQRPTLSRKQLSQSMEYIREHCFETIRLHSLASRLGLSESYFSHAFKASTGVPPLRWQMEARIAKVKELLSTNAASLTEIAVIAGFSDQAHLTRAFKKSVGLTPAQWRRETPASE